ncbi:hypothetical protein BH10BAC5_BH10BAC5_14460 [soil metagenome]
MPTSNWQNISFNIELVRKLDPSSVLDVGVGFGRWGILFREFLEIWNYSNYNGKWKRKVDGVEIFEKYIQPYHSFFYDNIFIEDVSTFLRKTDIYYDLINFGDVIEHFEKNEALVLIELALSKSKNVIINLPIGDNWEQSGTTENKHEEHKSVFLNSDFRIFKYIRIKKFTDYLKRDFSVILISNSPINQYPENNFIKRLKNIIKYKLHLNYLVNKIR